MEWIINLHVQILVDAETVNQARERGIDILHECDLKEKLHSVHLPTNRHFAGNVDRPYVIHPEIEFK